MLDKIRAAWRYSRTVFLNAVIVIASSASEVVSFIAGLDWASVTSNPRVLLAITLGTGVLNIFMRYQTTDAVGQKDA